MELARKRKQWPVIRLPEKGGDITVADVIEEPPGERRDEAIKNWCQSVWAAYREDRQTVVDLV